MAQRGKTPKKIKRGPEAAFKRNRLPNKPKPPANVENDDRSMSPRVATQTQRPELLAPAGSKASWAAAVMAGADAVYVGLNDFSARSFADNFSLAELKAVIEESHKAGVKINVAMNALLKEGELGKAFKLLDAVASFGPDALIIQDLGLARLARKYFPSLARHASTLMATHSLPGLAALAESGFSRAVLARELALDEIAALADNSPIEVEIFIHGALCFSISGLCLMSSFLGGRSALRGACTQPCRRVYSRGGQKGAFFSTTDLKAAPYLYELRQLPIAAFKIEGRMKGPDYVDRVVRAYRLLLDAHPHDWNAALEDAENILANVPERRSTGGPLAAKIEGALAPLQPTTSGLKLGWLESERLGWGRIKLEKNLAIGDRLRLQSKMGGESTAFNLKNLIWTGEPVDEAPAGQEVLLGAPNLPEANGVLFKVSSGREEKYFLASSLAKSVKNAAGQTVLPAPAKLPPEFKTTSNFKRPQGGPPAKTGLWVWLDAAENIPEIAVLGPKKIILTLSVPNVRHIRHHRRRLKDDFAKLVWSLPPVFFYHRQNVLRKELAGLLESGAKEFMVSSLAQINILKRLGHEAGQLKMWGDHRLGVLNHMAEEELIDMGLHGTTFSLEADEETLKLLWKAPAKGRRLLYLYGKPALFSSRFPLDGRKVPLVSPKGEKFRLAKEDEITILTADKPILMAPFLKMSALAGNAGLIVDLRGEAHLAALSRELKKNLNSGIGRKGSSFNFKRGLI